MFAASDYAMTADGGDYTVHVVVGVDVEDHLWLLDLYRRQADPKDWVEAFCDLVMEWKPIAWAEENVQITSGIGPYLESRQRVRGLGARASNFRPAAIRRSVRSPSADAWRSMGCTFRPTPLVA